MKKVLKIFLLQVCIIMYSHSFAQTNFSTGFDAGFKEGFCYNKSIGCLPPLTPMTPLTKIGESDNSYQDGYNRGFQVGLDLQRLKGGLSTSTYSNPSYYTGLPKYTPSQYIPPVDLKLLANVLERKQRLYDSRLEWIQTRIDKILDMAVILLEEYSPDEYSRITSSFTKFIDVQLNSSNLDFTDNSIFNQIINIMNQYERQIYSIYSNILSEISNVIIPKDFSKTYTNGSCFIKASNSNITSYSITDNNGKKLTSTSYEISSIQSKAIDDIPSVKVYYLFSKTDNNYYKIGEDKVEDASRNHTTEKMKFVFSSEVLFKVADLEQGFWLFDKGVSKSGSLNNLGYKVFKTSNGKIEVFRVYQDKYSARKYYIPKETFDNGTVNQEYPIYSN